MIKKEILKKVYNLFFSKKSYSINDLDLKLVPYLSKIKNGFFVEAGANDGIAQSNTLYFEKKYKWRGILVEAIPELASKARKNRPGAIVEEAALVSETYNKDTITMRYGRLMSVVSGGMKSKLEEDEHIHKAKEIKNIETYSVEVKTSTLTKILDKNRVTKIDFLSLDIEGYELQALLGLDMKRFRPRYILVEARYKNEIDEFMKKSNYKEIAQLSHHDYLYEKKTIRIETTNNIK